MDYLERLKRQKEILDREYDWPADYMFKFIVPVAKEKEVRALFPHHEPNVRESREGNYLGLTFVYRSDSSDLILAIYEKAYQIDGLIAL